MRPSMIVAIAALCVAVGCDDSGSPSPSMMTASDAARTPDASSAADAGGALPAPCSLPAASGPCNAYFRRFHHDAQLHSCESFVYGGCQGNDNNFETLAACESACNVSPRSTTCSVDGGHRSLLGVNVHIEADRCRVQTDQHHIFRYRVTLPEDIEYTTEDSGGSCGSCRGDGTDVASLIDTAVGDHQSINYCECDTGCCPPTTAHAATLKAGSIEGEIDWPGRQWNGPSDTNVPLGEPFPPGDYSVSVALRVSAVQFVTAELPIQVIANAP